MARQPVQARYTIDPVVKTCNWKGLQCIFQHCSEVLPRYGLPPTPASECLNSLGPLLTSQPIGFDQTKFQHNTKQHILLRTLQSCWHRQMEYTSVLLPTLSISLQFHLALLHPNVV